MKKATRYLTLALFASVYQVTSAEELKPFTSDGCSAFPDGTPAQNELWLNCCIAHDRAYWKGGSLLERENADQELKLCVSKAGEPKIAELMLVGVKVGGSPYWPTKFRWGYGWPWPHFYAPLTAEEREQVRALESE